MNSPLVSVIVATYRRKEPLKKALVSLAKQTYTNFEIVLVDDNCNEKWNKIVKKIVNDFKLEYPNVIINYIINNQNQGSAKTRNIGIENAKGKYVTFLDDDDIYLPEKIKKQLNHFILQKADYGFTDLYLYNENDVLIDKRIRSYIDKTDKQSLLIYHLSNHMTGTDTLMFRKAYLQKIGCFDPIDIGDEFYLMQKAILGGGKFCYLPKCYVKAYVHTGKGGLSSGQGKIDGENALYEYKKTFFDKLDKKTIKYIKVRHYAVLAYAYYRNKKYVSAFVNIFKSFICSPFINVKMIFNRV